MWLCFGYTVLMFYLNVDSSTGLCVNKLTLKKGAKW